MSRCRGICDRYKATRRMKVGSPYETGKRCNTCEIFIKKEYLRCPCCKSLLQTKPRNKSKVVNA